MYNPTCFITGKKDNLKMHAIRNDQNEMTGWLFVHEDIDVVNYPHIQNNVTVFPKRTEISVTGYQKQGTTLTYVSSPIGNPDHPWWKIREGLKIESNDDGLICPFTECNCVVDDTAPFSSCTICRFNPHITS